MKKHKIHFHENGKVKLGLNYEKGKFNGIMKAYDEDGKLIEEAEYVDNEMVRRLK